jgi:hypothetical protein
VTPLVFISPLALGVRVESILAPRVLLGAVPVIQRVLCTAPILPRLVFDSPLDLQLI